MFSEDGDACEFSYVSGLDNVLFEIEGNTGYDEAGVMQVHEGDRMLCSVNYSELCEDIVHRGITLVHDYNCAHVAVDQMIPTNTKASLSPHHTINLPCSHAAVQDTTCSLSLATIKCVPNQPRIVPAILTQQSFEVDIDLDSAIVRIQDYLAQQTRMATSFIDSEFVWNCKQICGCSEDLHFEVRLYRYSRSHAKSGSLLIEMQRCSGERIHYFSIYESIKGLFYENESDNGIFCCSFETVGLSEVDMDDGPENPLGEQEIKQALLSVLTSGQADYKTLLETVQLAGTIFCGFKLSTIDVQIFYAMEHLSASHPQFYWLQPFVAEKRQALLTEPSLSFAEGVNQHTSSVVCVR